jgi:hypothetical protein
MERRGDGGKGRRVGKEKRLRKGEKKGLGMKGVKGDGVRGE